MKKLFLSLAALMMMSAPVMTSCSSDLDEVAPVEEAKENVVTLTIAPPVAEPETRVKIDDSTPKSFKISGWEDGDVVKVYNVVYDDEFIVSEPCVFTCSNPSTGTFTGTLPEGKTLENYNVAVYGHDIEVPTSMLETAGFVGNMVSDKLKDVLFMAGEISGGSCTMKICNNVIKVTNNGDPVEVAWYNGSDFIRLYYLLQDANHFAPASYSGFAVYEEAEPFTIQPGDNYISMSPTMDNRMWGLYDSHINPVIPLKDFSVYAKYTVGKLFTCTIGTASSEPAYVDLGLPSGLKWATFNIGASAPEDNGLYFAWGETTGRPASEVSKFTWANYSLCRGTWQTIYKYQNADEQYEDGVSWYRVDDNSFIGDNLLNLEEDDDAAHANWGGSWRMPTFSDMLELISNCNWVWTIKNGVNGYEVSSKAPGNDNSIFLPVAGYYIENISSDDYIDAFYWTSNLGICTDCAFTLNLNYGEDLKLSSSIQVMDGIFRNLGLPIRAVLDE